MSMPTRSRVTERRQDGDAGTKTENVLNRSRGRVRGRTRQKKCPGNRCFPTLFSGSFAGGVFHPGPVGRGGFRPDDRRPGTVYRTFADHRWPGAIERVRRSSTPAARRGDDPGGSYFLSFVIHATRALVSTADRIINQRRAARPCPGTRVSMPDRYNMRHAAVRVISRALNGHVVESARVQGVPVVFRNAAFRAVSNGRTRTDVRRAGNVFETFWRATIGRRLLKRAKKKFRRD